MLITGITQDEWKIEIENLKKEILLLSKSEKFEFSSSKSNQILTFRTTTSVCMSQNQISY